MKLQQQLDQKKEEIEKLKRQILDCAHDFAEPIYDPETVMEPHIRYGDYSQSHGSDYYPAFDYHNKQKDRWSRECKKCGKKDYTYENVKPVFGGPKFK